MEQPNGVATETDQKNIAGQDSDRTPKPDPRPDLEQIQLQDNTAAIDEKQIGESANGLNKSKKSVSWSEELVMESPAPRSMPSDDRGSNPYVAYSPAPSDNSSSFNIKNTMENVKGVLGRWGKKVGEATKKAEDLAGNTWQHLKTGPSLADAALGRIAQGTKVLAEGGYDKIFRQTFETVPEEQLQNSFACYLSTSAGPVMGVLYVSTAKLAFCSDIPLSYKAEDKTEWSYYKVVIPLHQLKAINPSSSRTNPSERYVQTISVDNHEFWFMGFLNYTGAVNCLQEALQARNLVHISQGSILESRFTLEGYRWSISGRYRPTTMMEKWEVPKVQSKG